VIAVIDTHGDRFGVEPICRVLGYRSASTVYARRSRPRSARALRDEQLRSEVNQARAGFAACYGAKGRVATGAAGAVGALDAVARERDTVAAGHRSYLTDECPQCA
jgi:hypothetical protein